MGRGQAAVRGEASRRASGPGDGRPLGPRRLCPGARRPSGPRCSTWPRCSKRRHIEKGLDRPLDEKNRPLCEAKQIRRQDARRGVEICDGARTLRGGGGGGPAAGRDRQGRRTARTRAPARRRWSGRCSRPTAGCGWRPWKRSCGCSRRRPFAGSSYVPQALGFFAASSGFRRALVACPNLEEARDLAGMLVGGRLPGRHVHQRQGVAAPGRAIARLRIGADRRDDRPARDRRALAAVAARPADGVAARGADRPAGLFRSGRAPRPVRSAGQGVRPAARR